MDFIKVRNDSLSKILFIAGIYNLLWGAWVVLFPTSLFEWVGAEIPNYPMIWQSVGLVVGVYGVGYVAAARNFSTHWPIVLVGFLGKLAGPFGVVYNVFFNGFHSVFLIITFFNDLIWWIPFFMMLKEAYLVNRLAKQ